MKFLPMHTLCDHKTWKQLTTQMAPAAPKKDAQGGEDVYFPNWDIQNRPNSKKSGQ